ncbi:MAG: DEAD/DEAH box helicase [Clostridia bacterium]|nr:DEAD/DEAH box helicase [Clostridia bacterium]
MKYKPHDYQSYATEFILKNPVAAILLQMGLGKSVITLTAIRELLNRGEVKKVLVVAPLRVARDTWPEEIRKWDHLRGLTYSVAVGTADERRAAVLAGSEITVINRENVPWLVEQSGIPFRWDMVVIDELSSFKNWQAKRFRSLMKVRPFVKRIVGLTGTPSPNGYMDLFAEYRLLDMGVRLGRFIGRYREAYFTPDRWGNGQVFSWKLRPGADEAIYRKISDITVSMKSVDHLKMPECVNNEVPVRMDPRERAMYETLKEELFLRVVNGMGEPPRAASGGNSVGGEVTRNERSVRGTVATIEGAEVYEVDAKNASVLCGKLSQLANGAVYTAESKVVRIHDRKLDALEDLIESANGNPLLVAYWFQHDLWRMKERFPELRVLKSPEDIRDWNAGRIPVAAIHPASCGHGLNLQAGGSTLVWFGLTWSLELYQQTNARLWRQGQRAETVVIHHIVTEDTIDERILQALRGKDQSQERLIDAVRWCMNGKENVV